MEAVLLAIIIFLLIILILIIQPRKIYIKRTTRSTPGSSNGSTPGTTSGTTSDTTTGNRYTEPTTPEEKQKQFERIAEKVSEKGCGDETRKEKLKSEIKKIITCKCADDPEFCKNRLEGEQGTLAEMESMFIDVELDTPCLDKEYIAFEKAVANMILKSGVDVCELSRTDLKALGGYINDLVDNICGFDGRLLDAPNTWDQELSGI